MKNTKITLPSPNGTATALDLRTGSHTISFQDLPTKNDLIGIAHVSNGLTVCQGYGVGLRLNLDEQLLTKEQLLKSFYKGRSEEFSAFDYVYIDAEHNFHGVEEYFHYTDENGNKIYVDAKDVTVSPDGSLKIENYNVTRELRCADGWNFSTVLDGVKKLSLFEQRSDERQQLEEQIEAYERALEDYMVIRENGEEVTSKKPLLKYESANIALEDTELLLPTADVLSYRSLLVQKKMLETQQKTLGLSLTSYDHQKASLSLQAEQLAKQKDALANSAKSTDLQIRYNDKMNTFYKHHASDDAKTDSSWHIGDVIDYNGMSESIWSNSLNVGHVNEYKGILQTEIENATAQQTALQNQINNLNAQIAVLDGTTDAIPFTLKQQIMSDLANVTEQRALCIAQIDHIKNRQEQYRNDFSDRLIDYLRMKNELLKLRRSEAISFLPTDNVFKCFNSDGMLCAIVDKHENYIVIERNENYRIERVYNQDGKGISLRYVNNRLFEMATDNGEKILYSYYGDCLKHVTFENGKTLSFEYDNISRMISITSSATSNTLPSDTDFTGVSFSYNSENKLIEATLSSNIASIEHGIFVPTETTIQLAKRMVEYTVTAEYIAVYVTDENGDQTRYCFNQNGDITSYHQEKNGVVTDAKLYSYVYENIGEITGSSDAVPTVISQKITMYADETTLFQKSIAEYIEADFERNKMLKQQFNKHHKLCREETTWTVEHGTNTYDYTEETLYTYDQRAQLVKAVKTVSRQNSASEETTVLSSAAIDYFYDTKNNVIRTETYNLGKENTLGKTIEEKVYDEKGHVIRSFSYNSLDPSSKFYTESETDENGITVADLDATGKHKTRYSYFANGLLASETAPNGGTLSYSYDENGNVNAITQSSADGEANSNSVFRTAGEVTKLVSGNNTVNYSYEDKRRLASVKLNGKNHVNYTYADNVTENDKTVDKVTTSYANGYAVTATYDQWGNLLKTEEGSTPLAEFLYTDDGKLTKRTDLLSGNEENFVYDEQKNLTAFSSAVLNETIAYDLENKPSSRSVTSYAFLHDYTQTYTYDEDTKQPVSIDTEYYQSEPITALPKRDTLQRYVGKKVVVGNMPILENTISYLKHGDHATNLPKSICCTYGTGKQDTMEYTYDSMGNISAVYENDELVCRYEYDSLNRLTREDNKAFGKSVLFAYDSNGNITSRREFAFTTKPTLALAEMTPTTTKRYTYDGDKLMSFDGEACAYDAIGNPTTYRGQTAVWGKGRLLKQLGNASVSYDAFGRKEAYYDHDGKIVQENSLFFSYDETGVHVVKHLSTNACYVYQKDVLGNICALLDTNGNVVVQYKYDAWGNCKVLDAYGQEIPEDYVDAMGNRHIGHKNPFRYRGYYFDTQTGLYYLQSRFYDPETGRFLNADTVEYLDPESINGLNLYAYCGNNPVMYSDPSGHFVITTALLLWSLGIAALAGGIAGAIYGGMVAAETGQSIWGGIIGGFLGGAIMGAGAALATLLMAPLLSVSASFTISVGTISASVNSLVAFGVGATIAFGTGAAGGAVSEITNQLFNNGGTVTNWSAVGTAALQYGFINLQSAFYAALGEARVLDKFGHFTISKKDMLIGNIKINLPVGFMGMILDYARSGS